MASLRVGNLSPGCTEELLYQTFSPIGNLLNIKLCKDSKTGRCLGYGFVNYVSKTDAQSAMLKLNHILLNGRAVRLMWEEKNIKHFLPSANLFIKNLHFNIDEKVLYDIFSNYGSILSLKLAKTENGTSKGFAFIQYEEERSAEEAIKVVHGKLLLGKVVHLTKFLPKEKRTAPIVDQFQNVYLKNFDSQIRDTDLTEMCRKFGDIVSAKVMFDDEGKSKCFGFVSFTNPGSASEAIGQLNGKVLNGRRLFAGRAKRKSEREKEIVGDV